MQVAQKNNPEKLEQVKKLQEAWKNFPAQEKLFDRLKAPWPEDAPTHPKLLEFFNIVKIYANAEQLGGNESYFKFMRMPDDVQGLTFNDMAYIFNYIENLTLEKVMACHSKFCEPIGDVFLEVFEFTYLNSAKYWNNQVDQWKKEIEEEKAEIAKKVEVLVNELNQGKKKLSRKERKEQNQS